MCLCALRSALCALRSALWAVTCIRSGDESDQPHERGRPYTINMSRRRRVSQGMQWYYSRDAMSLWKLGGGSACSASTSPRLMRFDPHSEVQAPCNMCVKLFGHMSGVTESTSWTVGEDHHKVKGRSTRTREQRGEPPAPSQIRAKVTTAEGVMTVKDLDEVHKRDL